jgi:RNA polymerase sigma factor (sigma-70 family)
MMDNRIWKTVVAHAEALAAPRVCDHLSDADLLQRFIQQKDNASFSAIVRRHGPLVWSVCRHLTANECDAEDTYQASFLALFRHAHRIRNPNALGAWLHGVAGRVSRNSLRALTRRKHRERSAAVSEMVNPIGAETWDHWHHAVHREIDRLPEMLRVPFVMCVLQGVPQAQAAERLGWKIGTLSGRLCKAKQALTKALEHQGLTGAVIATVTVGCGTFCEPLSAHLAEKTLVSTLNGSGQSLTPTIHQLAHGATGGFMSQLKWLAVTTTAGIAMMGAGGLYYSKVDAQSKAGGTSPAVAQNPPAAGAGSFPGSPPGGGSGASMGMGSSGMPGISGMRSRPSVKVEYRFIPLTNKEEFKQTLIKQGEEGWEYVGTTPVGTELVFKQVNRAAGGSINTGISGDMMPGMPGMPSPAYPGMPGVPNNTSGYPGVPGMPGGSSGFGRPSLPGAPGTSSSEGSGMGFGSQGFSGPGGLPGAFGGGGGAMMGGGTAPKKDGAPSTKKKEPEKITLRQGETMRLEFANVVKSTYSSEPSVVEISLDSTDPRRVILKPGNVGIGGGHKVRLEILSGESKTPEIYIVTFGGEGNPPVK